MSSPSPARSSTDSRRRSSGAMFSNLSAYKRGPENVAYQQRRTSVSEMSAQQPGMIGTFFNNVFKGPSQSTK